MKSSVLPWVKELQSFQMRDFAQNLSPEGAQFAWEVALLPFSSEALDSIEQLPGSTPESVTFIAANTVFTAPLEWCIALLHRGTRVYLKPPSPAMGLWNAVTASAHAYGLPLFLFEGHHFPSSEVIIAMGSDETIASIVQKTDQKSRFFGFGNRFSAGWITQVESLRGLAQDVFLYDSRGCMSPSVVFSPWALDSIRPYITQAFEYAEKSWPLGELSPLEYATIRERQLLGKVTGKLLQGTGWSVVELPQKLWQPNALPRTLQWVVVSDEEALWNQLKKYADKLSTFASDTPLVFPFSARVCGFGEMQRPPLFRKHDGITVPNQFFK